MRRFFLCPGLVLNEAKILLLGLWGIASILPVSSNAQSLSEAFHLMQAFSPEVKSAEINAQLQNEEFIKARAGLRPSVEFRGGFGKVQRDRSVDGLSTGSSDPLLSRQIGVTLKQLLWDGGHTKSLARSEKEKIEVENLLQASKLESEAANLVNAYFEILKVRERLAMTDRHIKRYDTTAGEIKEALDRGADVIDNYILITGRKELTVISKFEDELALMNATERYLMLVGEEPKKLKQPGSPNLPLSLEKLSLNCNPEYQAALIGVTVAESKFKAQKSAVFPKLHLSLGHQRGRDVLGIAGEDNEMRALVEGSWSLTNGGARRADQRMAEFQLKKAKELVRIAQSKRNLQAVIINRERQMSKDSIASLNKFITKLKQVEQGYDQQLETGRKSLLDILDIRDEQHRIQRQLLDAVYREREAEYRLLAVMGKLANHLAKPQ